MAFHIIAFHSEQDEAGQYTNLTPVVDPTVSISGNYVYVPELNNLIGYYIAGGSTASDAYFQTPSLRKLLNIDVSRIELGISPVGHNSLVLFENDPIPLERYEGLEVFLKADPATAEKHTAVVFLSDGALAKISGQIFTVKATSSINATSGKWSEGTLSLRQSLPVGTYAVVGAVCVGSNLVAFRFIPIGYAWRPGGIAVADLDDFVHPKTVKGGLGTWFTFDARNLPSVEVLAVGASTNQTFYIDLIKIA